MSDGSIELDWDDGNIRHFRRHHIRQSEFEQVLVNCPLDLECLTESGEDRYISLGATDRGSLIVAIWTVQGFRIRPLTAFPASPPIRLLYEAICRSDG